MDIAVNLLKCDFFGIKIYRIIIAFAVLTLFLVLRHILVKPALKLLYRMGRKLPLSNEDQLLKSLEFSIKTIVFVLGIYVSVSILQLPEAINHFLGRAAVSIVVFVIFYAAYLSSNTLSVTLLKHVKKSENGIGHTLTMFFNTALKVLIIMTGISILLQIWGYNFAALITGLGLGGLAFALAAKDTVANLFGSIMIMFDRPFTIGDLIITSKVEGIVESIGFRSTRIRNPDQSVITIPNSLMSNEYITNMSRTDKKRINFRLSLIQSSSSEQIRKFTDDLRCLLENQPDVEAGSVIVCFERINGTKLDIYVNAFINASDYQKSLQIQNDINFLIKEIIETTGITLCS